jgi:hypothetical protein
VDPTIVEVKDTCEPPPAQVTVWLEGVTELEHCPAAFITKKIKALSIKFLMFRFFVCIMLLQQIFKNGWVPSAYL